MYSTRFPVDQAPDPNQEQLVTLIVVPRLSKWARLPWKTGTVDHRVHSCVLAFSPQQPVECLLGPKKGKRRFSAPPAMIALAMQPRLCVVRGGPPNTSYNVGRPQ